MKSKLFAFSALMLLSFSGCTKTEVFNKLPVADAGADIKTNGRKPFTIKGSGKDSDGKIVAYLWSVADQISNGGISIISPAGATDIKVSITSYGQFDLQLMVVDDDGAVGVDRVRVFCYPNVPDTK